VPGASFTVVVPTLDHPDELRATLRSIIAQQHDAFDVVVVDDGSAPPLEPIVQEIRDLGPRCGGVDYLWQSNAGPSAARNQGAARGAGEYLVFLDTGDRAEPDWLARLGAVLGAYRSEAGSCGVTMQRADGTTAVRLPRRLGPLFGSMFALPQPGCLAIRRDVFHAVGGFDELLRFSENTEFGIRLGAHIAAVGGATVHVSAPLIVRPVPAEGSQAYSDQRRLETALYILDLHADRFAMDPRARATYLAVAAVAAARLGRSREARQLFAEAAAADPRDVKNLGRLAVASLPPLQRRVWRAR
jgi:glycosyltransferase involved in cell wall biosynthesis